MNDALSRAYFLVGPTASGKSAVAQKLAETQGRSIVSADSMNIYIGMDIGTAKPTVAERRTVGYAGVDLAEPTEKFSVAAYLEAVRPAFASPAEPIVVGGTGLYVKCLTEGFDDVPPEQEELRAELESHAFHDLEARAKRDAVELYNALTEDDRQNPRRLIRILEKVETGELSNRPHTGSWNSTPKPRLVGLQVERETLLKRIEKRVDEMYADGLLDEAEQLLCRELSQTAMQAIGYAEAFAVLRNEMTVEEAREQTIVRTRQLAKRQMTWFRNQLNVEWIDTAAFGESDRLAEAVAEAWERIGSTTIRI